MIKRLLRVLDNKGLTLLELLIALVLFVIITVAATTAFMPTFNTYLKANELAEVNTILDNVSALIMEDVIMAESINITPATPSIATSFSINTTHVVYYYMHDGVLTRRAGDGDPASGTSLLDQGFFRNATVTADIDIRPDGLVTLTLIMESTDEWSRTREYMARPVRMQN